MTDAPEDLDFVSLVNDLTPANRGERRMMDRYRDFREVFFTTEAGRRVLDDILFLGWVTRPLPDLTLNILQKYEGMRRLALYIAGIGMVEPSDKPVDRKSADDVAANQKWKKD